MTQTHNFHNLSNNDFYNHQTKLNERFIALDSISTNREENDRDKGMIL